MPFIEDTPTTARQMIGPDIWTYSVPGNETVLDTFLGLKHSQGLSPGDILQIDTENGPRPARRHARLASRGLVQLEVAENADQRRQPATIA